MLDLITGFVNPCYRRWLALISIEVGPAQKWSPSLAFETWAFRPTRSPQAATPPSRPAECFPSGPTTIFTSHPSRTGHSIILISLTPRNSPRSIFNGACGPSGLRHDGRKCRSAARSNRAPGHDDSRGQLRIGRFFLRMCGIYNGGATFLCRSDIKEHEVSYPATEICCENYCPEG